jgi:small subunit ribosomal protein S20
MAHSLSAKKRVRQNAKKRVVNRARKSEIKTQLKDFDEAVKAGDKKIAEEQYKKLVKKVDKLAVTSTMHKNKAARIKSRMAKRLARQKG